MENNYIHFTKFNLETIESIFKYGIMSKYNLNKNNIYNCTGMGYNGKYYISLTKINYNQGLFKRLYSNPDRLGIELISDNAIKTTNNRNFNNFIFKDTPFKIRYSPYIDEWQTKEILTKDKFIALHYPIENFVQYCDDIFKLNKIINDFKELKKLMKLYDINIPLITNEKVYEK